jgi:UDP-glucose 4-epimerase
MKIGILGASGFIGSGLTNHFITNKTEIELHLFSRNIIKNDNFPRNIKFHKFDLNEKKNLKELYEVDILYYLISDGIPLTSWNSPIDEFVKNLIPFVTLIEKIKTGKLKKIIFTSSAGTIYGQSKDKISENSLKFPFSPYGIAKLTTEYFLDYFKMKHNISYEIYRISNIYGPNQKINKGLGLINTLIENHVNGKETIIYGDGSTLRNYIYIRDVVTILGKSIDNNLNESNIINLASNDNLSINNIITVIEKTISQNLKIKYSTKRNSDNPFIAINNEKLLNSNPKFILTPLDKGILETYKSII